ncbi:MAG: alpha/beta fold hydrolase, partial [Pseudomonadales bacterium]|nr:alpha/beta fold hydrolase [Pseudomonadales bacterium]
MANLLLVHGAWHGGWCWREVAALLTGRGHRVFAPSLTGLAERGHLIDCVEGPDTHVEDIVRLIEWEGLDGFTLVGHSYGGTIVTGVASRMPERISRLVYLDAMVPEVSNQSAAALSNPQRAAEVAAARRPDGHTDPTGFERWVSPERIEWLKSMATPQPGSCFGKGVTLNGAQHEVTERDYIICLRHKPSPFWQFYEKFRNAPDWRVHELDSLHDAMIEVPEALV